MIPITMITAGLLGLMFVALAVNVSLARRRTGISIGDGAARAEAQPLLIAMRMHANFAEHVPLALILLGLIETGTPTLTFILAVMLVLGRLAHPLGMTMPAPNKLRAGGAVLTWLVILIAAAAALIRGLAWA